MTPSGPNAALPEERGPSVSRAAKARSERFGPERRLHTPSEFRTAQANALRVQTEPFVLLLSRRADGGPGRLGLIASRKVGNAVRRNRWKRLLREAFRRGSLPAPAGTDVIVIFRAHLPAASFTAVDNVLRGAEARLNKALARLGKLEAERDRAQGRSP